MKQLKEVCVLTLKENCPICGEELESYFTTRSGERREITIYWDCLKCEKEFKSKYKITLDSISEVKI